MARWRRAAVTWGKGLGLDGLAVLPAIPAVRSHLIPAWWPSGSVALVCAECVAALALIDCAMTLVHMWWHGPLARLHATRAHHLVPESEIDWTTGQLFGPWEPLMGVPVVWSSILVWGIPLVPVVFATSAMLLFALWAHTNWRPQWYRWLEVAGFVTPVSHRVHHSADPALFSRNCGFVFNWWDRALGNHVSGLDIVRSSDELSGHGQA